MKVMHPHLADDEQFVARFNREARSAARMSHHNVVAVYDQGRDDDVVYLVMEHVPGTTLRDLLDEARRPDRRAGAGGAGAAAGGAGRRPQGRGRPPRRQAGERAAHRRRPGQGRRLRAGPRGELVAERHHHRAADGHRRVPVPRAGPARRRRRAGRRLRRGHRAVRDAHRAAAVHRRGAGPGRLPARARPGAGPTEVDPGVPAELDSLVTWATAQDPDERPVDARELLQEVREVHAGLSEADLDREPAGAGPREPDEDGADADTDGAATPTDGHHATRVVGPLLGLDQQPRPSRAADRRPGRSRGRRDRGHRGRSRRRRPRRRSRRAGPRPTGATARRDAGAAAACGPWSSCSCSP